MFQSGVRLAMKFWNIHDDALIQMLGRAIGDADVEFAPGVQGGVAIYRRGHFVGLWVETHRGCHSFYPAARLQPTLCRFNPDQVLAATRGILEKLQGTSGNQDPSPLHCLIEAQQLVRRPRSANGDADPAN